MKNKQPRYTAQKVNGKGYIFDSNFSTIVPIAVEKTHEEANRLVEKYNNEITETKPMKRDPIKKTNKEYIDTPPKKDPNAGYYGPLPQKPLERKTKQRKKSAEETKPIRPNPFSGADDTYLTKNKIAVTRTKHTSSKRGHKSITQTKYYEQNDSNMRALAKVTDTVRIGRKGNKGFKRLDKTK